jgi:hypothetical protein
MDASIDTRGVEQPGLRETALEDLDGAPADFRVYLDAADGVRMPCRVESQRGAGQHRSRHDLDHFLER